MLIYPRRLLLSEKCLMFKLTCLPLKTIGKELNMLRTGSDEKGILISDKRLKKSFVVQSM